MSEARHPHRVVSAAGWSALEISVRYGAQLVLMVVLARLLPPSDFGLVAMLTVFTNVGALLVNAGFGTALVQRRETTPDDETTVFLFTLASGILLALALVAAAPAIAAFYRQPALVDLTRTAALVLPLGALGAVPDAMLTRRLDFRARTNTELMASTLAGAAAIVLALRGQGVWSLVWQSILAIGLRSVLLWRASGWWPQGTFRLASFQALFGFGGFMLMSSLLDVVSVRLQSLLIGRLFDARTLGYYTLAQNTQQAPTSFVSGVVNRVGLPVFSAVAHDPPALLAALRQSLRVSMFLFVPCMLGLSLAAGPLVEVLFGTGWAPTAPLLSVLALAAALWPLHSLNLVAISAQGRSDLFFKLGVLKKTVGIALVLLASRGGPLAIAWSTVAAGIFSVGVNTHYSRKLLGYGLLAQVADQRGTLCCALAAAAAGWAILHWATPSTATTLLSVCLATLAYVASAAGFRVRAYTETLFQLRSTVRGGRSGPAPTHEPSDP